VKVVNNTDSLESKRNVYWRQENPQNNPANNFTPHTQGITNYY